MINELKGTTVIGKSYRVFYRLRIGRNAAVQPQGILSSVVQKLFGATLHSWGRLHFLRSVRLSFLVTKDTFWVREDINSVVDRNWAS